MIRQNKQDPDYKMSKTWKPSWNAKIMGGSIIWDDRIYIYTLINNINPLAVEISK